MVFLSEHLPHDRPHTVEDVDAIAPAMLAQARPLVITPVTPRRGASASYHPCHADAYGCLSKPTPTPTPTANPTATRTPTPDQVEADAYWCLSKLLDSIQDHYTFAQPGIQRMVFKLKARYTPLACSTP